MTDFVSDVASDVVEAEAAALSAEAAVTAAFLAYEQALVENDVDAMNAYFLNGEEIVRYGIADEQWGFGELVAWRKAASPVPAGRRLSHTKVQVLDERTAVVTTLFSYPGRDVRGRQTQVWRLIDERWLIVNAHVSERELPEAR